MKLEKKTLSLYFLYVLLISLILFLFFNLKSSTNNMLKDLNTLSPYLKNENWDESKKLLDEFNNKYKKTLERITIITNDIEVNNVYLLLIDIFTNIELKNKDTCLNKLENLKFSIKNLYTSQIPSILNIF